MLIGYVSFIAFLHVQIMQFPVLDFELDQYGCEPFILHVRTLGTLITGYHCQLYTHFVLIFCHYCRADVIMHVALLSPGCNSYNALSDCTDCWWYS